MPRKYIKIKYLAVLIPFRECLIQFVVRNKENDPLKQTQIQFFPNQICYTMDENIQFHYSQRHMHSLALYSIAINKQNRVSSLGWVSLDLTQSFYDKREDLEGVEQQKGYIIYSMQNEPFQSKTHLVNFKKLGIAKDQQQNKQYFVERPIQICKSQFVIEEEAGQEDSSLKQSTLQHVQKSQFYHQYENGIQEQIPSNHQEKAISSDGLKEPQSRQKKLTPTESNRYLSQQNKIQANFEQNSEYKELQAFIIELLKHKIKNSFHFTKIAQNAAFMSEFKKRVQHLPELPY